MVKCREPLLERELELEQRMLDAAAPAYYREILNNHLLSRYAKAVVDFAIKQKNETVARSTTGLAGKALGLYSDEEMKVAILEALVALLRIVWDDGETRRSRACWHIGNRMEVARLIVKGVISTTVQRGVKKSTQNGLFLPVVQGALLRVPRYKKEAADERTRQTLGLWGIQVVAETTGLIVLQATQKRQLQRYMAIRPTDAMVELMHAWKEEARIRPLFLPMVMPPDDWGIEQVGGGYKGLSTELIRMEPKAFQKATAQSRTFPLAPNRLQAEPFRLDRGQLKVLQQVWTKNHAVGCLPARVSLERPEKYVKAAEGMPRYWDRLWAWGQDQKRQGVRTQVRRMLDYQHDYGDEPLWFPAYMDYRGRLYQRGSVFGYQADDVNRSVLVSAKEEHVSPEGSAHMLRAVDGWMNDAGWAERNWELIQAIDLDPMSYLSIWSGAKKPWCCLQMMRALAANWRGEKTGILVQSDQTTSGYGHLAWLTHDEALARSTNLIGSEKGDVYQDVRVAAMDVLRERMRRGPGEEDHVEDMFHRRLWWEEHWPDRELFKALVLPMIYGSRWTSRNDLIMGWLLERRGPSYLIDGHRIGDLALELSQTVGEAVKRVLPSVATLSRWLSLCSSAVWDATEEPLSITLPAPHGLTIQHKRQRNLVYETMRLPIAGRAISMRMKVPAGAPRKPRGARMAPDLIHGLDACLAHQVIGGWDPELPIAAIHDCFSTTPNHVDALRQRCRDEMRSLARRGRFLLEALTEDWSLVSGQPLKAPLRGNGDLEWMDRIGENPHLFG